MMKKSMWLAVALGLMILTGGTALAGGWYVDGYGGAVWVSDSDLKGTNIQGKSEYDTGYNFGGALGYDWGMFRLEGELGYRSSDVSKVTIDNVGSATSGGSYTAFDYMVNGYLEYKNETKFYPFVMGGIGGATVSSDSVTIGGITAAGGDDTVFAYQLGAGIGFAVTDHVILELSYRYFGTDDPDIGSGSNLESEYKSHNVLFGLRYTF